MSQSRRDHEAETVAKSTIVRLLGENAVDHIDVFPTEDSSGEEGLSVTIFLNRAEDAPSLGDTLSAVSEALRSLGDSRFPYVTFLAPGYEHAEDDARPAA
jgi:hypothetical protein